MTGYRYLASYPRSGNTLLRMILYQSFGLKTVSQYPEETRFCRCPRWRAITGMDTDVRAEDWSRLIDAQGMCPVKTHGYPAALGVGAGESDSVIYVIRDGRETCVSYWRYYHDILEQKHTTLRDIIRGEGLFGGWSDHLKAWRPERRRNTLFLRYEEMKIRPGVAVGQIARFLDRVPTGIAPMAWHDVHSTDPVFFRAGRNDTWRELMTGDDLALFDELHGDTMREYGYCETRHVQPV